jgi:hypothetical protein
MRITWAWKSSPKQATASKPQSIEGGVAQGQRAANRDSCRIDLGSRSEGRSSYPEISRLNGRRCGFDGWRETFGRNSCGVVGSVQRAHGLIAVLHAILPSSTNNV